MSKTELGQRLLKGMDEILLFEKNEKVQNIRVNTVEIKPAHQYTPDEIKSKRKELNMSIPVFAKILNMKPQTVEAWENGRRNPTGGILRLLDFLFTHENLISEVIISKRVK